MAFIPVPFNIFADSGVREGGTVDSPTAEVKFSVKWSDRITFVNFVCGATLGGPGAITRLPPLAYPPSPNLYATRDFAIEPLGKLRADSNWVFYDRALVTITFAVPQFDFPGGPAGGDPSGVPWTTTTFDLSGEFLTLPDSTFKFSGGKPLGVPAGRIIPQVAITFKRHWVPYLPVSAMFGLLGKVNNAAFSLGDFSCPAETLLFLGGPNQRQSDTSGHASQEVEYKMIYRPVSWNKFLHPDGVSGFQYINDGNGNKVYDQGDFTTLP